MKMKKIKKIIGRRAVYTGKGYPFLKEVQIYKIMRQIDTNDPDSVEFYESDEEIAYAGGIKPSDRVEVQPVLPDGRLSWVTSDPYFRDLTLLSSNKSKSQKGEKKS